MSKSGSERQPDHLPGGAAPTGDREALHHTLTRRAAFGTVLGGVSGIVLLDRLQGRLAPQSNSAQSGSIAGRAQPAPSPQATPVASPFASPVASPPPASPVPATPEPITPPDTIGQITVFRGESFEYADEPVSSETLTIVVPGGGDNLNFNPAAYRQDFQIAASYLDPLLWINDVTMEPRPWLAERWEWDDSGRSITFSIRRDIRWHDGNRLHARDVAFSFEVYRDDIDSGVRNLFTQMEAVEAIDAETVRVDLLTPDGNWLFNAATQPIFQRRQYLDHWRSRPAGERTLSDFSWDTVTPIGTGPWKVTRRRSVRIEFERNDDYFAGPPHFQALNVGLGGSQGDRLERWRNGEGDILPYVSVFDLESVQDVPAKLYATPGARVMFAAFNFDNRARAFPGLLRDIRIRRALALAIDRRHNMEVARGFLRGYAAGTVAQPWARDDTLASPDQDLDEARRLLGEAGLSDFNNDGALEDLNGEPLRFSAIVRDDADPLLIRILSESVDDIQQLGVGMELRVLDPEAFYESWASSRDYDLIGYSYALYPGFTDFDLYGSSFDIRINPQGWNPGGYSNEDVDSFIRRILITVDIDRQREVLRRLQETVNEDLFGTWLGFPDELVLARPEIQGYQPNRFLPTWNTRLLWREK
jgi:ABC-type transport system substrate-binding protein